MYITPEEYIVKKPQHFFIHGLDALKHCLRADTRATAYGNPEGDIDHINRLRAELEAHAQADPADLSQYQEGLNFEPLPTPLWDEEGDLDVESYLDGDELCFVDYQTTWQPKSAFTVVMELNIHWGARGGSEMARRHKIIYELACQAEAERRPCRVVCGWGTQIDEFKEPMGIFIIIKDYEDPIFPGIWGAFKTNASTNDFMNVVKDYLVGTHTDGNGRSRVLDIAPFFEDDCILVEPSYLKDSRKTGPSKTINIGGREIEV
jgi:hypothetical protein